MPDIKFDFYSVKVDNNTPLSFLESLNEIAERIPSERFCTIDGEQSFLSDRLEYNKYYSFLFTKIRMTELPVRTNLNGDRYNLELDDDEGLGEDVGIAYSENLNILSIQRNRHSLSANNIVRMINEIHPELNLQIIPILKTDALDRFYSCKTLKKLHLKLAGKDDLSFLNNSSLSANEKMMFHELMSEPYIDISFSVGRRKSVLSEKIKNIATFFTKYFHDGHPDTVLAVEVSGKEQDSDVTSVIDLLQDRLIHNSHIDIKNRTIDAHDLLRAACVALSSNYEELRTYAKKTS